MKNYINLFVFVTFSLLFFGHCSSTKSVTQSTENDSVSNPVSFKAREYFLKGLFLQGEERYSDALIQFHKAQIFDTTSATIQNSLAENYIKLNELEPAEYHLKKAHYLDPKNIATLRLLGEVYFRQRHDTLAINAYKNILVLNPYDEDARNFLLFLYEKTRDAGGKASLYEDMLSLYGPDKQILRQLVDLYIKQNDYPNAIKYLDREIEIDSSNARAYFQKADLHEKLEENEKAAEAYSKALEYDPDNREAAYRLALIYRKEHKYNEVINLYTPILKRHEDDDIARIMIAESYYLSERPDSAAALLLPASQKSTAHWRIFELLGQINLDKHQYDEAINYFNKSLDIFPANRFSWLLKGFAYSDRGDEPKAEETFQKALDHLPKDAALWSWYGISLQKQKKFREAIAPFERAITLDPKNINALSSLPVVYEELDMISKSDSIYSLGLENLPDNALLLNNFAYSLAERSIRLQEALDMALKAISKEGDNGAYLDTVGWIYFKMENYKKAEKYTIQSLEKRPKSAVVLDHMGDIYWKMNNYEKAREYWHKSLELDPENKLVSEKLEKK